MTLEYDWEFWRVRHNQRFIDRSNDLRYNWCAVNQQSSFGANVLRSLTISEVHLSFTVASFVDNVLWELLRTKFFDYRNCRRVELSARTMHVMLKYNLKQKRILVLQNFCRYSCTDKWWIKQIGFWCWSLERICSVRVGVLLVENRWL